MLKVQGIQTHNRPYTVCTLQGIGIHMNEQIMRALGFDREVDLKNMGKCVFCECTIDPHSFRDELSAKEYKISGMCQACQDQIFGK